MAYIYGQRSQKMLFPASIDEYLPADDPVRVYDAFINELNFANLGIRLDPYKGGPDEYDPKTMLKIIVYGYSMGVRSSRRLELACQRDIAFVWLTGNLSPDYRTIARFRKEHSECIRSVLRELVRLCIKWNLVEGNALFVDSTAMEADASIRKTFTPENLKERLNKIDARINTLLHESARLDQEQENLGSLVKVEKELLNLERIRADITAVENELNHDSLKELNTTDRDCVRVKAAGRCRAGYKVHTVVDGTNGLIINSDVVSSAGDRHQLSRQIENAGEVLGKDPATVVSDSGYACIDDAAQIPAAITLIMPSQQQVAIERSTLNHDTRADFTKDKFSYDAATDTYRCPAGERLTFRSLAHREDGQTIKNYRAAAGVCMRCAYWGRCTNNPHGRKVMRHELEHIRERLDKIYQSPFGQMVYAKRKIYSELPHAHIKHNARFRRFLLRGLAGVNAEFSLHALTYNMTRLITLVGAAGLLAKLHA
jgi:transposase